MSQDSVHRYSLVLPADLYDRIKSIAEEEQTTVLEIMKRFLRLGLVATQAQRNGSAQLILREGDRDREILLV